MESIKNISNTDIHSGVGKASAQKPDDTHSSHNAEAAKGNPGTDQPSTSAKESGAVTVDFTKVAESIDKFVHTAGTKLTFKYDERISRPVIIVRDQETGEVIRQIPLEQMRSLINKLEYKNGIFFRGRG